MTTILSDLRMIRILSIILIFFNSCEITGFPSDYGFQNKIPYFFDPFLCHMISLIIIKFLG